jgi:hypothetical protein
MDSSTANVFFQRDGSGWIQDLDFRRLLARHQRRQPQHQHEPKEQQPQNGRLRAELRCTEPAHDGE